MGPLVNASIRRATAALFLAASAACAGKPANSPTGVPSDPQAAAGSIAPRLSRYGDRVVLSWIEPGAPGGPALRFAFREGSGWSAPCTAVQDPRLATEGADAPGIAPLSDGSLAAFWSVKRPGSTFARDLEVAVSRDGGTTWSAPAQPHRDGTATAHGMATLVPRPEPGRFGVAWLDGRAGELSESGEGGTALYWADWNGAGFDPEIVLDPRVCDCCKTAGAMAPAGPLLAYRDRDADERRDTSTVRESGGRWSAPSTVHADDWRLTACPTNGPAVATSGDRAVVAWFTAAGAAPTVSAALSSDGGITFAAPLRVDGGSPSGRVDAAILPDGSVVIVWLEKIAERGEVRARRIGPANELAPAVLVAETSAARTSGYPRAMAVGARDVLVAWTDTAPPGRVRATVIALP